MQQVKIFKSSNITLLEQNINDFLVYCSNKNYQIVDIKYAIAYAGMSSALIIYK